MSVVVEPRARRPAPRGGPRARARAQPRAAAPHLHRRLRDAGVGLPQAARRAARRSCSSPPSRASASAAGRSSASARAPTDADGSSATHPDPYAAVAEELGRYRIAPLEGLPPFAGGAVGLFGYDLVRSAEPTVGEPNPDETGIPDLALMITDVLVAFDHLRHEVTILANVFAEDDLERSYGRPRPRHRRGARAAGRPGAAGRARPPASRPSSSPTSGADGYAAAVERAKEYIRAGDAYQVVPSQRWSADCPVEAFSIYRGLRAINPSPYMYFLDFEDFEIAGASPESLVKVSGRRVEQRPIAGTRPRATRLRPRAGRRAAGRREGARRARDARRPRPQRPRPRVRVRQRAASTS